MKILVKVAPQAKENKMVELDVDMFGNRSFKLYTTKPPIDGAANEMAIKIVAEFFKVNRSNVKIISGHTNRNKLIEINK